MPEKLVVEVGRYDRLVFGRVLSFPELIRGKGQLASVDDEFVLGSHHAPELTNSSLCLPGVDKNSDSNPFSCCYANVDKAKDVVDCIRRVVGIFNRKFQRDTVAQGAITLERVE